MDIAEHDEEFTVMASSSLQLSVIDASPNNIHFINMAQDTDEYAPVSSTSSLKRTTTIDTAHLTNEYVSVISSSSLRRTSSSEFYYLELYKAVLNGDWESASKLLKNDPRSLSAPIGTDDSPVLHIAVELGEARMGFVEKLVEFMPSEALALRDSDGATALFNAARAGNIKAVKLLVNKNPSLPNICQRDNFAPLHSAIRYGHKELTLYLLSVTRDDEHPYPFSNSPGIELLRRALMVGFHDVALYLVEHYPDLATCHFDSARHDANDSDEDFAPLTVLAKRPWAFPSGSRFNLWQLIIYHFLKVSRAKEIFRQSFINGAKYGIPEILEEIIKSYPFALEYLDEDLFKLVVLNRYEKIFNLICETGMHRQLIIRTRDDTNNDNILHLAGKLAPPHRLSLVSGAALQMQRELHWFKEIEKYAPRAFSESENENKDKPKMAFIKEHEKLIKEGEKWMKGTAKFYTLAAALIATVVFAAAITIPGGNHDDTGIPNFSKEFAFKVFAVSDALSLFLSIASVLICLSNLTTRYAEDDFLFALPRRLIFGLVTLFLSVTFMMIAYSGAIYLLFGEKKAWILIALAALACFPVTLYGILQFPLLVELIYSTYGPGIFGKHSNRLIR
ncbi:ankyrin repeat-containing protein ITN1-like isoform X6 [Vitis riparia]|uniref:ankyrin repeat-containing protein ITN1-like isoform X6 n=1 Tax=Vitis riparia TaxID=96939 RepID=UPI00155A8D02|nr:ankyrin repeat-containing protein ITN1-like isoform X6 [Vitis riparia]